MDTLFEVDDRDQLLDQVRSRERHRRHVADLAASPASGLRFAFYARTSTVEYQDPVTSRAWQREVAESVIDGRGVITAEFMDIGWSREVPWARRPQAAALLAAARSPGRSFDAVVVGEYERGFTARQFLEVAEQLGEHGVRVWLPEADGPVDPRDPGHRALITLLGAHAKREFVRARHRTLAAMRTQTVEQGRFLGGRPPYGYRLVDAGPHPNRANAAWGRRRRRLDPDPATAPHVQWMFERRLAGCSMAGIARELNDRGVACPSRDDSRRHGDRASGLWTAPTVGAILSNPRYTGRETWSRRQGVGRRGRATVLGEAAVSKVVSHPGLVTETDFVAAQQIRAARAGGDPRSRRYVLSGLVRCGHCGRRMDAHWVHGRAAYRCRHGHRSASARSADQVENTYVREDKVLDRLAVQLAADDRSTGPASPRAIVEFMRSNNMVIEVYDTSTWAVTSSD
ncbi:recombinase family protein [Pseudonocardia sp. CA-107938]|uniref:recombinase family protein n=1 Tax=Pseudonocardia sp. CA-107938 TaxID=3240021 RepID=UPI003D8B74A8